MYIFLIQMVRFHMIVVRSALAVVTLTSLGGFACAGTDHTGPGSAMTQVWHAALDSNAGSYWEGMPAIGACDEMEGFSISPITA